MAKITKFKSSFAQVPNALLQDSRLSFKARGLWAYMQSLPEDWDFAVERIATDKDGKDSVRSGLFELEAAGYLVRKVQSIGKGGAVAEYVLMLPVAENSPPQKVAMAENPPAGNPPVDIGITKTQITTKKSQSCASPTASANIDPYFDAFWQKYPNKKGKGQAYKAFRSAMARADLQELAAGFKKFLTECEGKDKKFIPYAATWLNGDRWLDDYEAPTVSNFGL